MTWSSRIGKLRTRDNLLERVGRLRPWRGDEVVADVGCGRGLMLIGAAKKLERGTAIGLDVWRSGDQSGNSAQSVMENARDLPLADGSVDVVLTHWVIHNIESETDRRTALDEMWRILRPGGVFALADIAHVPNYLSHLSALSAECCEMPDGGWDARIMRALSCGSYKPQTLLCVKPMSASPR